MLTLVSLSAYMAIAAAGVFVLAFFVHLRWWYRHTFDSLAEAFAASDAPRGRLGMIDVATGVVLFGLLGVPQALYTVFPGSVTPVVLILTGGATIGLFGLGIIYVVRGYALAFLGARYRAAAGLLGEDTNVSGSISEAQSLWGRLGELTQAGPLGEGPIGMFQLLLSIWILRVGFAMAGAVPFIGLTAFFVGLWGFVAAAIGLWRGLARPDHHILSSDAAVPPGDQTADEAKESDPDQKNDASRPQLGQAPLRNIGGSLALTILWFAALGIWLLL